MRSWNGRIAPKVLSIVGGEPTMHPHLPRLARACFPHAGLRVVSNCFFLHRRPERPLVLREAGRTGLHISIRHDAP